LRLKILEKLRTATASLNSEFTGSYKKSVDNLAYWLNRIAFVNIFTQQKRPNKIKVN